MNAKNLLQIVALAGVLFAPTLHASSYSFIDLGTLGGTNGAGTSLNANGKVVGYAQIAGDTETHGFSVNSDRSGKMDLGTLGGSFSEASGINASGQVAGDSSIAGNGATHAMVVNADGTGRTDLGTLGGTNSWGNGINATGQVVGYSETSVGSPTTHAFSVNANGSSLTDLGTLGGTNSVATGINATGQVVGFSDIAGNAGVHAFVDNANGGNKLDLGTFVGGVNSQAFNINDNGKVVGQYFLNATDFHAFAINADGTGMHDLQTLGGTNSAAIGINTAGDIVGFSDITGNSADHAFILTSGVMEDLNLLTMGLPDGWWLQSALAINDLGQITGSVYDATDNSTHAYLLNPFSPSQVPEPASLWLLVTGLAGWRLLFAARNCS